MSSSDVPPERSSGRSPEERWWSVRAGEYVLGTLRGEDLTLFERILEHDTSVQGEVVLWEKRLAALNENTLERTPGEHVWPLVLERIRGASDADAADHERPETDTVPAAAHEAPASTTVRASRPEPSNRARSASPHSSRKSSRRSSRRSSPWRSPVWPALAGLATAASVVLGVLLYQRALDPSFAPLSVDGLAVVLADEGGEPYFLVETDYGNLRVRVTALSPPELGGERDFQLWQALPDRSSVRPVALLPEEAGTSSVFEVDSLIDGSDLFGVSIEPVGAPTDDGPTGPVVAHGDFLSTREAD